MLPQPPGRPKAEDDLHDRICRGGFPEPAAMESDERRRAWFGSYVTAILQRDIRELAHIDGLEVMPRLLAILAARPMGLLNFADLSRIKGFVGMELKKQCAWSRVKPGLFHFRSHEGSEVDFILEEPGGRLVGVEVKASTAVAGTDFKGLRYLADRVPKRFHCGVVLHTGDETLPFGPKLYAVPVQALWRLRRAKK
jgi:predicted AAA+ superfamily ATPase